MTALLALALGSAVATQAAAEGPADPADPSAAMERARGPVAEGLELFRDGSYSDALKRFRDAERILQLAELPMPATLDRILARCHDQLGEIIPALRHYQRFLANADPDDPGLRVSIARAEQAVVRLENQLARTAIRFDVRPAGVEIRIDGKHAGATPLPPMRVAARQHLVTLTKPGHHTQEVEIDVAAGAVVPVIAHLEPVEAQAPAVPPPAAAAPTTTAAPAPATGASGTKTAPAVGAAAAGRGWLIAAIVAGAVAVAALAVVLALPEREAPAGVRAGEITLGPAQ